jgi:D-aspartate ligase
MDTEVVVRRLRSLSEGAAFQKEMDALNERSWRPCPFSSFEFLRNHCEHDECFPLGKGREVLMLLAFRKERLVGYLPLRQVRDSFLGVGFGRIESLFTNDLDRPHIVCAEEDHEACARAFFAYLQREVHDWDALELADQEDCHELVPPPELVRGGWYLRRFENSPNATIHLRWRTTEEYFRAWRGKARGTFAHDVRRLFAAGDVEYVCGEGKAAAALFEIYADIECRSWKAAARGTLSRHPERLAFFRGLLAPEQPMRLQIGAVVLDGLPIAAIINGLFGRGVHVLQTCFDEAFAALGPGQLCLFMTLRSAIERGFAFVNLLHGTTFYKERWLAEVTPAHAVQLYRVGSAPFARAKLGELRRAFTGRLGRSASPGALVRRELVAGGRVPVGGNRAGVRAAYRDLVSSGLTLERYQKGELAAVLPTATEVATSRVAKAEGLVGRPLRASRSLPPVAIFDADSPPALAFTRSLGRARIPVCIYSPNRLSVARASRFAASYEACPDPLQVELFLPWLAGELKAGRISIVAPTSDQISYCLAELYDALSPEVQAVLPTRETCLNLLFKDRFNQACAKAGVPTPWCICPRSVDEARDAAAGLPYPVILKPKSHVGVGVERGRVVENRRELEEHYRPYEIAAASASIVSRYPELRLPMIQEYVPAALENLFSISGVLNSKGEAIAFAGMKKTAQWPPALGVGTLFETFEERAFLELGVQEAQVLAGRGLFELELILDRRSGHYVAIDLNPRAYGQISLDIARGHDLPLLWYRMARGEEIAAQAPPHNDVRWVHSIPYHVGAWVALLRGPGRGSRLEDYVSSLSGGSHVDIVNDRDDPLPSVLFTAKMLRHPRGLVRSFLSSPGKQ